MINFKKEYNGNMDSTYIPQYALGAPTSVQTANQIAEATARLNAGVYGVDLALIDERIFESVPKQHFKEIDRLMKLTGAKASIHGPIVDLAGFTQQGWQEETRKENERKVKYYMDMAHELDAKGNTPLNFHINTAVPGEQRRKLNEEEYKKLSREEKKFVNEIIDPYTGKNGYEIIESIGIVDQETGQLNQLRREVKQYPSGPHVWTPEIRLESLNQTEWDKSKLNVFQLQQQKAEIEDRRLVIERERTPLLYGSEKGVLTDEEKNRLTQLTKSAQLWEGHINELNQHIQMGLREIYNDLKHIPKNIPEDEKEEVNQIIRGITRNYKIDEEKIKDVYKELKYIKNEEEKAKLIGELRKIQDEQYKSLQRGLNQVPYIPRKYIPTNELALEKTAETVANVVFDSYKKYKDNSPIMLLENLSPEGTLGSAQDLINAVKESRKRFANKLIREKNLDEQEANKAAEKLIGVTWDVGHINFLRKYGYSEEDIKRETEKIAPYVKKVHITDNFGYNDSHLPPGMGNAPIKEEMELIAKEIKKKGLKFEKGDVLVEAGGFVAQFKENPQLYALEYFDSPLYKYKTEPYWKEIWEKEAPYFTGYGPIFPEQHFNLYGAGFSNLPAELGGQITQDRSRFAGTPNA